jgi:uncharacterized repeat protein (TIGR01451 family)
MPIATLGVLSLLAGPAGSQTIGPAVPWPQKVDPWVLASAERGETEFLVFLREQADLRGAALRSAKEEKGRFVVERLTETARRSQGSLLAFLSQRSVEHRAFWVANMIWVKGDLSLVQALAERADVAHVYANPTVRSEAPRPGTDVPQSPEAVEWGIDKLRAPLLWSAGFTGQGIVVGGQDTGYDWDHPALKGKYRGWNGSTANHNYNWHDSIHSGGGVCGPDSAEPCDDQSHGTHTMGTMVGADGTNQIGMAPGAKWIGCRNMNQGVGTPATYSECFQWFIAPTNLAGQNPDPTKAPHVINNSWGCPPSEGCTDPNALLTVVQNTRAAGIVVVVSAGNAGSGCSSVNDPPAIYDASFSVGATSSTDAIASFSSRGPVTVDGSNRLKPDVSAPGVSVRSSIPGGSYSSFSGTSMAGPHVAGLVTLLLSANPGRIGQVDAIEGVIQSSAVPRTTTQTCGGVPGSSIPNNTFGHGRVDAYSAVQAWSADLALDNAASGEPVLQGQPFSYTLTATNLGPAATVSVGLSDTLPSGLTVNSITASQGSCSRTGVMVNCALGSLAANATATVEINVTAASAGTLTNTASVTSGQVDLVSANNQEQVQTTVAACPPAAPAITAPPTVAASSPGLTASVPDVAGHSWDWTVTGGTLTDGQGTNQITFTSGPAGTTMTLGVVESVLACESSPSSRNVQVEFLDVPPAHPFYAFVNTIARNGVTQGCGAGSYCPDMDVKRDQMAAFLLRAKLGAAYVPPDATGVFADVPIDHPFADWIEDLAGRGITSGCSAGSYCPGAPVTRAQMAVFLLRTKLGAAYVPPAATGIFADVPPSSSFAPWIEDLFARGITSGCGGGNYCPDAANTRGQMAVFLTRMFGLN